MAPTTPAPYVDEPKKDNEAIKNEIKLLKAALVKLTRKVSGFSEISEAGKPVKRQLPVLKWNPETENPLIFLSTIQFDFKAVTPTLSNPEKNQCLYRALTAANETWHWSIDPHTVSWKTFNDKFKGYYCSKKAISEGRRLLNEIIMSKADEKYKMLKFVQIARRVPIEETDLRKELGRLLDQKPEQCKVLGPWQRCEVPFDAVLRELVTHYGLKI